MGGRCLSAALVAWLLSGAGAAVPNGANAAAPNGADAAAELDAPALVVQELHEKLLSVMQRAAQLGYPGRYRELEPFINSRFDFPFMSRVILGRYRQELDEAQTREFIRLFSRLSTAVYARRFNGHNGEVFLEVSRRPLRKGRALVKTELRRPAEPPASLDYLLHERDGKWYIIGVSANGVNDLSLKRAEYAAVIKAQGYPGLIEEMRAKIQDLEAPADGAGNPGDT